MMDIQKLKHLASEADRQVTWSLVPFDLHKDEWETDVVNYIGAISPATITDLLNRLEKAEAQIAELAKQESRHFYREHNNYNGMKTAWEEVSAEQVEHLKEITDPDTAEIIELFTRAAPPAPEVYNIGDATMRHIFKPTGMTNISDFQAVFDRIEVVLTAPPAPFVVKNFPARKSPSDYVDESFGNDDLAAIWNSCRLACKVKIQDAGGEVADE